MSNKIIYTAVDRTPYTYLIGWQKLDKWYYGVRFAKGCHPKDLWVEYFTQSEYVNEFRKNNGDPDIIQIRKIFDSAEFSRTHESRVLRKLNVVNNNKFLNKTASGSISPPGMSFAFYQDGTKCEFVFPDDIRLITGEICYWGNLKINSVLQKIKEGVEKTKLKKNIKADDDLTSHERANLKRKITVNAVDEDGLTILKRNGTKIQKTLEQNPHIAKDRAILIAKNKNIVGEDGLTTHKRAGQKAMRTLLELDQTGISGLQRREEKRIITNSIVGEDGLTGWERGAEKTKISNSKIGEDGLSGYKRASIKAVASKNAIGEDGLTGHQRGSNNTRITQEKIGEDGLTGFQRLGLKVQEARRKKAQRYNVMHIDGSIRYLDLILADIRKIDSMLQNSKSVDKFLGSNLKTRQRLIDINKEHLIGLYLVKLNKEVV